MKKYKEMIVAVVMGCFLLTGCGNSFEEAAVEYDIEHDFVVEFEEDTVVTQELIASIEKASAGVMKTHPYENLYRFEKEDATHEELESICLALNNLPDVKLAQTEWDK